MSSTHTTLSTLAGLVVAAGAATPAAKGDIDLSFSLNLGWCAPDPCYTICEPAPIWGGCDTGWSSWSCRPRYYSPWYSHWHRPYWGDSYCAPRPYWNSYSGAWYGSSYTTGYYSSGFGGWYSTSTTYYSPYYDYYRPVSHWGFTVRFGDDDCDDWRWRRYDRYNRWDRHDRRDGDVTIINNGGTVNYNGRGGRQEVTTNNYQTESALSRVLPRPVATVEPIRPVNTVEPLPAESFGVRGPEAQTASKGPRRVTEPSAVKPSVAAPSVVAPVAVKPIESGKPSRSNGGRPTLPTLTQSNVVRPVAAKPSLDRGTFDQPAPQRDAIVQRGNDGKPIDQAFVKPIEPVRQADKAPQVDRKPSERTPYVQPVEAKPSRRNEQSQLIGPKPTVRNDQFAPSKPVVEQRVAPRAPEARPQMPTGSPSVKPSMPGVKPTSREAVKPNVQQPAPRPQAMPSAKPSAPAPAPKPSAPAARQASPSRASAPAPSPRPSAPAGKPAAPADGNKRR